MGRKSEAALARHRASRRAIKRAMQRRHRQAKGDNSLYTLVHEYGLMSDEEKLGWEIEHHSGYCRGERHGCPHCGSKSD